jgi:hypothetical protein
VSGSTTYFYRVRAYNSGGNSAYSTETSATTPAAPGIDTGMVGHWTFDETSGTVASDSSGNGNNGTLVSGPVWTPGKIGGGLSLNGTSSYVMVPDSPTLDIAGSGSITVWVKRNALSTGDWRAIVAKGNDNVNAHYNYGMEFSSADRMEIDVGGGATGTQVDDAIIAQTDLTNWHQHGVVWNGTLITYYYDGLLVGAGWSQVAPSAGNTSSLFFGTFGNGGDFLNATIDDVRIYNRALTAADMSALYGAGTDLIPPSTVNSLTRTDRH